MRQPANDLEWFVEIDENGTRACHNVFRLLVGRYPLSDSVEQVAEGYHNHHQR